MWDKLDQTRPPDLQAVGEYISTPLWPRFLAGMAEGYQLSPEPSYSGCSMLRGWNFKFRKAGRSLCTVYPMAGYFSALVALGPKESEAAEQLLPALSDYTRKLHAEAGLLNGTRWLLLEVTSQEILEDLRQLLALRRPPKNKSK